MDDRVVLEWAGDIDVTNARAICAEVDDAVGRAGGSVLVIDMSRVGFVDSSGLGALVRAKNSTLTCGTTLVLRSVPAGLRRLLDLTGMGALFQFEDDRSARAVNLDDLPAAVEEKPESDGKFDRVAGLVARLLNVPTAIVSFVDREGQVFPGAVGLPQPWQEQRATPLSHSFCQHVVARAAPMVVADARHDPLLADNRAVDDLGVVAYAGMPLTDDTGRVVGSLCAIDSVPREWTSVELENLRDLAGICSAEVTYRSAARRTTLAAERERFVRGVQDDVMNHLLELMMTLSSVQSLVSVNGTDLLRQRVEDAVASAELALTTLRATVFDVKPRETEGAPEVSGV